MSSRHFGYTHTNHVSYFKIKTTYFCSFSVNEFKSIRFLPPTSDSIDCSRFELEISQELVNGLPQDTTHILNMDNAQLRVLLEEMKYARSIMDKYDSANRNKI